MELRITQPVDRVAQLSTNRGMPSTSQLDGFTEMLDKNEKFQKKNMEKK